MHLYSYDVNMPCKLTLMYIRTLTSQIPKETFLLFGPRQVGKSTILQGIPALLCVDLLNIDEQLAYSKTPNLLRSRVEALPEDGTIIIDEIQRVPALLDVVHSMMEKRPKLRFIMSGSSARKLRHGASNLLGGRALYRTLHPLTISEMGDSFDLERVLAFGSLPKIWSTVVEGNESLALDLLRSYVTTYIKEEIKSEALVRNLSSFQNFLDVASAQFAEQVNFNGISRDCQVAYTTVREFYSILEDTLIGFFVQPYLKSVRKRMSHQPKFYFFDNGVTRALLGMLNERPGPIEKGRLFEQWCIQEISRINEYGQKDWKFYFWRTAHGAEVDLLIGHGSKLVAAIEFKAKTNITNADLSGLKAFQETIRGVPRYVVANVGAPQKLDDVTVFPPKEMMQLLSAM